MTERGHPDHRPPIFTLRPVRDLGDLLANHIVNVLLLGDDVEHTPSKLHHSE